MGHIRKYEPGTGVGRPKILVKCNRVHMTDRVIQETTFLEWCYNELDYEMQDQLKKEYVKETKRWIPKKFRKEGDLEVSDELVEAT